MKNTLDLKPQIDTLWRDVWMAIRAEEAEMNYQDYLERQDDESYDDYPISDEMKAIQERIAWLTVLADGLKRYGENLQRWHR